MIQLEAVLAATLVIGLVVGAQRLWSARARGAALAARQEGTGTARLLYFSGPHCSVCRTHQEPALKQLVGVPIQRVDAVAERELADRYRVFTVPTTVVLSGAGATLHVNYGYTPAGKLREQLAGA